MPLYQPCTLMEETKVLEFFKPLAEWCAALLEILGIGIITLSALYALGLAIVQLFKTRETETKYREVRQRLGRGILLGLEFLVGGDIIHTVAVELTFETLGVLALVVLIRTFLSFTLEVELTGRWPWQKEP